MAKFLIFCKLANFCYDNFVVFPEFGKKRLFFVQIIQISGGYIPQNFVRGEYLQKRKNVV